jgi:hypothetical protein
VALFRGIHFGHTFADIDLDVARSHQQAKILMISDKKVFFHDADDGGAFEATEACTLDHGRAIAVWEIHGNVVISMDSANGEEHVQIVMTPADFAAFTQRCMGMAIKFCAKEWTNG